MDGEAAGEAREGGDVMDTTERARLRALYEGIALPWEAVQDHYDDDDDGDGPVRMVVLCPHGDTDDRDAVATIDMGHGEECDEAHAALVVGAVNALRPLLDALDAAERDVQRAAGTIAALRGHIAEIERELAAYRKAKAENDDRFMRERDEARAEVAKLTALLDTSEHHCAAQELDLHSLRGDYAALRTKVAQAHAEGFVEARNRAAAACDAEEAAGVAERERLVTTPGRQLHDLSRQEGRYHAANRLRFAIDALVPDDAEAAEVCARVARENDAVIREEIARAVAARSEACAAMLDAEADVREATAGQTDDAAQRHDLCARAMHLRGAAELVRARGNV